MAATVLRAGEVAIIGYNGGATDGTGRPPHEDNFHFVLLSAIGVDTIIYFTDRAWSGTAFSAAGGGDGTFAYTAGADLPAGTVITITQAQLIAAGIDFVHTSGEAIYVYQGTTANTPTTFLFALEAGDGNATFNASLAGTGLVAGANAVSVGLDSGAYAGPTTHAGSFLANGAGSPLIASISDAANWVGDDEDGQKALEAQVQTGPWLIAPRIDIWGTAAGGGGAIFRTSGDQNVAGGADDYNHAQLYNGLLNGGVSVFWNLRDMVFDTVEGKFFVIDSDIGGGHNRVLQGNIADLNGSPGTIPTLTTLYSDTGTTTASRLDNLDVDVANNIIYFTHGGELLKIGFDAANQAGTLLFRANVSNATSPSGAGNPAGSTFNFFNDVVINFATGDVYLSSTRVSASSGGDIVQKNFIYQLTGLTTSSGVDAFQFNGANTGTARLLPFLQNDDAYNPIPGTTSSPASSANQAYFLAQEYGTLDGLALDPASNTLYFSTGAILFDHDEDGDTADVFYQTGIIGRYALTGNPTGAHNVLHSQPGGQGSGLYGDLEIDVAAGKWYVTDYNGTGASNEDSHIYQGNLAGLNGPRTQFSQAIGNIEGLSAVGFTINHAPTLTGTGAAPTTTETSVPSSGVSNPVALFTAITLDDIDTGPGDELSGAVVRVASGLQTGAGHQDLLRINGAVSGTLAGSGIVYTYNSTTGALVLTGAATVAEYKTALELVTFAVSGDNPTNFGATPTRTIAVAVSDGLSVSDEITTVVTVAAVNDAPINTIAPSDYTSAEDAPARMLFGLSVSDADADPANDQISVQLSVQFGTLQITTSAVGGVTAGQVTGNNTSTITVTGTQNQINISIASPGLTYIIPSNFNGADTLTITTNDLGLRGNDPGLTGTGTTEQDVDTKTIPITFVNDAPTVAGDGTEDAPAILEDTPVGQTVASLFGGQFADAADQQQSAGNPTGTVASTLAGIAVTANGSGANGQWQYFSGGVWINIGAASTASAQAINAATQIRFSPTLNYNGTAPTLTATLIESGGAAFADGDDINLSAGGATGGTTRYTAGSLVLSQAVSAVNDLPVNTVPGAQPGTEDTDLVLSGVNAIRVADVDNASLSVTLSVAQGRLTLSGTAGLTVTGDGTGSVALSGTTAAINTALNGLTYRGNLNFNGSDSITVTTSDGGTPVQNFVAVPLAADGRINGDAGNNVLTGTGNADLFIVSQAGSETLTGLGGDDAFVFGAFLDASDSVGGGAGTLDQLGLQGNYGSFAGAGTPHLLGAGNLVGIEQLVLLPGNDARFGDTSGALYSYNLKTVDANVAAGGQLIVTFNTLRAGENVRFDGSAETDGTFLTYGGLGNDEMIGGTGGDAFFFGFGRWGTGDRVDGGAGTIDQLGLQGLYAGANAIIFGANQIVNIEALVLRSGGDTRFGSGGLPYAYDITMNDGNVVAGQMFIVSANTLRIDETLTFNGSAESNGRYQIFSGLGADILIGGQGADEIVGGGGADQLRGGAGNDVFAYTAVAESRSAGGIDQILDFATGDSIDLSAIDANGFNGAGTNEAFSFIGSAAFGGTGAASAGQLRVTGSGGIFTVEGDTNGDGVADFTLQVTAPDPATPLTAAQFVL